MRIAIGNHLLPTYTRLIDTMANVTNWITQLIEAHPIISKAVIGFTTVLLGLAGSALLVVGSLSSIGGLIKMWPILRASATLALNSILTQARTAIGSLSGLRVPVIGMITLAGALYYVWRKNLWGIRNMVTAVVEGFKMAWNASTEGLVEVDDALAAQLQKSGIWDFAITMGKVFFRLRTFWNGLVEGFRESIDFFMNAVSWVKDIFAPVIESGQELLKFLGILQPVTDTQVDTWKAWGKLLGRLAPAIIAVIAAFKGIRIVKGLFGDVEKSILRMFKLIKAHPIGALVAGLVALGIYLYTHWEEVCSFFSNILAKIKGYGTTAADWIRQKWQKLSDWWNNLTLGNIFAAIYDYALSICQKVKQLFIDFKNWLLDLFSNLNPFNWQLPSWMGGSRPVPSPQVLQAQQTAIQSSPQGQNASTIADRYAKAYSVKKPENNALGGVTTHRTLSWIGENGPEVIIPLNNQQRSVALWLQAGKEIGMLPPSPVFNSISLQPQKEKTLHNQVQPNVLNSVSTISVDKRHSQSFSNYDTPSFESYSAPSFERQVSSALTSYSYSNLLNNNNMNILKLPAIERTSSTSSNERTSSTHSNNVMNTLSSNSTTSFASERINSLSSAFSERLNNNSVLHEFSSFMSNVSVFPHAEGGIFSQPHIGLVAEAGHEAVIPLENKSRGLPLLMAAASEFISSDTQKLVERFSTQLTILQAQNDTSYSLPILSQNAQYHTSVYEQHSYQFQEHSPATNIKVEVHAEVRPADIYIDGERVGHIAFRWIEQQSIRNGGGD